MNSKNKNRKDLSPNGVVKKMLKTSSDTCSELITVFTNTLICNQFFYWLLRSFRQRLLLNTEAHCTCFKGISLNY